MGKSSIGSAGSLPIYLCLSEIKNAGADMAQGGRRSGIPDCEPFAGFVLTPQVLSTSSLVLGPVLHRSGSSNSTNEYGRSKGKSGY